MKKILIKNSILTAIVLVLVGSRRLIFNILVGRNFGPEELGMVNVVLSTVIIIGTFVLFYRVACTKYISEYLGRNDLDSADAVFGIGFFFTFILSIIAIVIIFIADDWFLLKTGVEASYLLFMIPLIPLSAFHEHFRSLYYGADKVKQYSIIEIFMSIIFFFCLGISVFHLKSALLLPFVLAYLFFFVGSLISFRKYFKFPSINIKNIFFKMSKFSSFVLIGNFIGVVSTEFSILLTSSYVNSEWLGYYVAAYVLLKPLNLVPSVLRPVLYPIQSYQYGKSDSNAIKKILDISTQWLIVITSFICGIYVLLSDFILGAIFGAHYIVASSTLQILSIGMFFTIITVPVNSTLIGTKYVRTQSIVSIIYLTIMVVSWILLIPSYGIIGTAIGLGFGQIISMVFLMYYGWKLFDLDLMNYIKTIVYFSLILAISLLIQYMVSYYATIVSVGFFIVAFILVNKNRLEDICMNIFDVVKKKRRV